ncbi:MAG: DNA-binding transcriptional LysR family regulator [Thermoproteota archaeon]|jgi:DNA-binding transcriptional LysR family regulator
MNIDSNRLEAFFQVAKDRNFHRAASGLGITQSALSQRVLKLENELENSLFIRGTMGISLTEAGDKLLRYCYAKSGLENDFFKSINQNNQLSGTIRVACYSSILRSVIMPALAPLLKKHDDVHIEFATKDVSELYGFLSSSKSDIIISPKVIDRIDLDSVKIGDEEIVHIRAKKHLTVGNVFLDTKNSESKTLEYLKYQNKNIKNIKLKYFDDIYGIIDGVKLGYGEAVVSKHLVEKDRGVEIVRTRRKMVSPIYLYYYKRAFLPELLKNVINELKGNCKKFTTLK